jgi:excisionase family DNA binding protein
VRLVVDLSDEQVEAIAERAAELVLERLPSPPTSEFLNVHEAAELIRAKPQRVYDLLSAGKLTRYKDGSRTLVARSEVVARLLPSGSRSRSRTAAAR